MWVSITLVSITKAMLEARMTSIKDEECSVTLVGDVTNCFRFKVAHRSFNAFPSGQFFSKLQLRSPRMKLSLKSSVKLVVGHSGGL